ncbi:undecaprenyldiphospho-muramoylpentapeptide beta-N-acetylglucosaminyltransferase [Candidatus Gullanella endobia]|nr:undecaprenyldiphospho-muramoylpentapeptide beta-N-acetylglucosaminyltransferase [Candidatus Gullanella endobia]
MITKTKRLMVIAGGTGGHVFPGLVVAHRLIAQRWEVRWLGTANRIESDLVPQHGIDINFVNISGFRGKELKTKLLVPVRICRALYQARQIMHMWRPDIVLGMGGYVSGPGCLAAWSLGIPVILHEQNSIAGLTNRFLSKISNKVLQAFPGTFPHANLVGNPIRDAIISLPEPETRFRDRTGPIRVLIIGGSQGAKILNQIMPEVAGRLADTLTLWHQVGKGALEEVNQDYKKNGVRQHKVLEFIDDMASAYAWADIVICRAGALTVSEISTVGLPALFVPFMHKDRQQYWNARRLEQVGAAKIIEQPAFNVDQVSNILSSWDRPTLLTMAKHARMVAIPDATERIIQEIMAMVRI